MYTLIKDVFIIMNDLSLENLKQKALKTVNRFEKVIKWKPFSNLLSSHNIDLSKRGYEPLKDSIKLAESDKASELNKVIQLDGSLESAISGGNKRVKIVKLSEVLGSELTKELRKMTLSHNNVDTLYDYINSESKQEVDATLAYAHEDPKGFKLIYCSYRKTTIREKLPLSSLSSSVRSELSGVVELLSVSKKIIPVFEVLYLHKSTTFAEVRVDCDKKISSEVIVDAMNSAEHNLVKLVRKYQNDTTLENLNIFPAIKGFLNSSSDESRRIVELNFLTASGHVKTHRSRNRARGDLNECDYHAAGAKEINNQFDAFKIAVTWEIQKSNDFSEPELMLPGNMRMIPGIIGDTVPRLYEAEILNCIGEWDYCIMIKKLMDCIDEVSTAAQLSNADNVA
jgi:hypothetical protein